MTAPVIVSTPQDIALIDAVKGVNMFKRVEVPILGIVENMSYYLCPECGHKEFVFGEHGARETAERLGEKFLGEIPLNIKIRSYADGGTPIVYAEPDSPFSEAYRRNCRKNSRGLIDGKSRISENIRLSQVCSKHHLPLLFDFVFFFVVFFLIIFS